MKIHLKNGQYVWNPLKTISVGMFLLCLGGAAFAAVSFLEPGTVADAPVSVQKATPTRGTAAVPTPAPTATLPKKKKEDYALTLVNTDHPMQEEPQELVAICDRFCDAPCTLKSDEMRANAQAVDALGEMLRAAQRDGVQDFTVQSAYRGAEYQAQLFDAQVNKLMEQGMSSDRAQREAATTVALPGCSEHETGLAFDLLAQGVNDLWAFEGTPQEQWLNAHCWEYGFILRFPRDKEQSTGIACEPWHFRYVGKSAAREMHESGQCLEKYLAD